MKQGQPSRTVTEVKREPKSREVNPAAVSELGIHQVRTRSEAMFPGKGFYAPAPVAKTVHPSGSQGKRR